jgi:hypothetical protein
MLVTLKNLLNENWRTSNLDAAYGKDLIGVFYNRFDFNLMPMDTVYLHAQYHSYKPGSYHISVPDEDEIAFLQLVLELTDDEEERRRN